MRVLNLCDVRYKYGFMLQKRKEEGKERKYRIKTTHQVRNLVVLVAFSFLLSLAFIECSI